MSLVFEVKVVPRSGRNKWMFDKSGALKCYLKNPPERGLANRELVKLVAKALRIAQGDVEIISGATSRKKRLKVDADLTIEQFFAAVGVERQQSLFD